jgi:serine/threonine protein kinase
MNDPSFALSSSSESFVIHRARRVQNVADPLAGLTNQRKDTVRNLQLRRILGKGAQGQVYLAHGPDPSKLLAVKVNPKHATECVRMLLQEQRLLHRLRDCPFVLDLQASFHDTENFYIVTVRGPFTTYIRLTHLIIIICQGFHSGGDLRQLLKKRKVLDFAAAKFYLAEAVRARLSLIFRL